MAGGTEFPARFDHSGVSNEATENLNLKIENTKGIARGHRSFDNFLSFASVKGPQVARRL